MFDQDEAMSAGIAIKAGSSLATPEQKKRPRLCPEAHKILEDYWNSPDYWQKHPKGIDAQTKKDLASQVQNIPGCSYFGVNHTHAWFKYRQARVDRGLRPRQGQSRDPRFPSLDASALESLRVLVEGVENPTTELIITWAKLLANQGAAFDDVFRWVQYQKEEARSQQADHLPTPANTVSPEPSMLLSAAYAASDTHPGFCKEDPARSPVLLSLSFNTRMKFSPDSERASSKDHELVSAGPHTPASVPCDEDVGTMTKTEHPPPPTSPTIQAILQGVADAVKTPISPTRRFPTNAEEFAAMFAPYENTVTRLMNALETL